MTGAETRAQANVSSVGTLIIAAVVVAFTVAFVLGLALRQSIVLPISRVMAHVERVGRGDLASHSKTAASSLSRMASELQSIVTEFKLDSKDTAGGPTRLTPTAALTLHVGEPASAWP